MKFTAVFIAAALCATSALAQAVERSSFFDLSTGDVIEDSGVITVASSRFARTEAFEVVRRADGGRVVTSVITGTAMPYRVEGRWVYDAAEHAVSVTGKGTYGGTPADVTITVDPPRASIAVSAGAVQRTLPAPCDPSCLADMSPSALAMFTMTRLHAMGTGDVQRFNWIGQSLIVDQVLLEGYANIRQVATGTFNGTDVLQYVFTEILTDAETGETGSVSFNLYVDATHKPLAFATQGGTIGARDGFGTLPEVMPAVFGE